MRNLWSFRYQLCHSYVKNRSSLESDNTCRLLGRRFLHNLFCGYLWRSGRFAAITLHLDMHFPFGFLQNGQAFDWAMEWETRSFDKWRTVHLRADKLSHRNQKVSEKKYRKVLHFIDFCGFFPIFLLQMVFTHNQRLQPISVDSIDRKHGYDGNIHFQHWFGTSRKQRQNWTWSFICIDLLPYKFPFSKFITPISIWFPMWHWRRLVWPTCSCTAILARWQPNPMQKCPIACILSWIGMHFHQSYKNT